MPAKKSNSRREIGRLGEELAAAYLLRQGYQLVERNYHTRYGELDLICRQGDQLVFVEVRTRTGTSYGTPEESITRRKLRTLRTLVSVYLSQHPGMSHSLRIDAIAILLDRENLGVRQIKHYTNIC